MAVFASRSVTRASVRCSASRCLSASKAASDSCISLFTSSSKLCAFACLTLTSFLKSVLSIFRRSLPNSTTALPFDSTEMTLPVIPFTRTSTFSSPRSISTMNPSDTLTWSPVCNDISFWGALPLPAPLSCGCAGGVPRAASAADASALRSSSFTSSFLGSFLSICRSSSTAWSNRCSSTNALALRNLALEWFGSNLSTASASLSASCHLFCFRCACARFERRATRTSRTFSSVLGRSSSQSRPLVYAAAAAFPSPSDRCLFPAPLWERAFLSASPWSRMPFRDVMPCSATSLRWMAFGLSGCTAKLASASRNASSHCCMLMYACDLFAKSVAFSAL
mmetsp:Transcript_119220/g.338007  ORF Transcript_119220/g.338007 Transcript_119220/m.338007 type:complete len:337 (-) Transcript_119220:730-1740(-)